LIANTTFQDQQEQIEFRAFAEVQIQTLGQMLGEQREKHEVRENEFFNGKRALEQKIQELETSLETETLARTRIEEQMNVRCEFLQ